MSAIEEPVIDPNTKVNELIFTLIIVVVRCSTAELAGVVAHAQKVA